MQETTFNLENRSALNKISKPWLFDNDIDSEEFAFGMINCMLKHNGIGLAANQFGTEKRVFVMGAQNIIGFPQPFALFNPRIVASSEDSVLDREGCLSFPGLYLNIKRPAWVAVEYEDYNGVTRGYRAEGYASKCVQHELDHLNGICFIDIVSPIKLKLAKQKQRKNFK